MVPSNFSKPLTHAHSTLITSNFLRELAMPTPLKISKHFLCPAPQTFRLLSTHFPKPIPKHFPKPTPNHCPSSQQPKPSPPNFPRTFQELSQEISKNFPRTFPAHSQALTPILSTPFLFSIMPIPILSSTILGVFNNLFFILLAFHYPLKTIQFMPSFMESSWSLHGPPSPPPSPNFLIAPPPDTPKLA